jgi:AbrB family looped-hinge helix DNA binding protein
MEATMFTAKITSLSSKGQVVIPVPLRKSLGLSIGSKMMIVSDGTNLLLKPIETPKLESFKKLISESRKFAKSVGLKRSDLTKAIKKAKRESSN